MHTDEQPLPELLDGIECCSLRATRFDTPCTELPPGGIRSRLLANPAPVPQRQHPPRDCDIAALRAVYINSVVNSHLVMLHACGGDVVSWALLRRGAVAAAGEEV